MDDAGTCAGIRPQLGVYLTGAIAPADRVVVVRHLTACDGCRAELAGLAGLPALLRRPPVQAAAQEPATDNTVPDNTVTYYPERAIRTRAIRTRAIRTRAIRTRGGWSGGVARAGSGGAGCSWPPPSCSWSRPARAGRCTLSAHRGPGRHAEATMLQTRTIGDVTVLTDDEGYTLYWFGPDSATKSACQDSCARSWPPVTGPATWRPGVTGSIGAIVRPGGALQATYDGHPLYTTTADTGPGQTKGNDVWSHGGEWHEVTVPGRAG